MMQVFLSYQTLDKKVAGEVRVLLDELAIKSFLAHEDIEVSHEWRLRILDELRSAEIFVAILSKNYVTSPYCLQESGIAISREMTVIPLSIDGTIPPGFMAHIQSRRIEPGSVSKTVLLSGIAKYDVLFAIDCMINILGRSGSYRTAEANFATLLPFLGRATDDQIVAVLEAAASNGQIAHANLCASEYLPPLLKSHGRRLKPEDRRYLEETLARYSS